MLNKKGKEPPQDGIYALVSGAGSVVAKDGLVAVIMVEQVKNPQPGFNRFMSTVYGDPAIVLVKGPDKRWHITGPVDQIKTEELLAVAEGIKILAERRK